MKLIYTLIIILLFTSCEDNKKNDKAVFTASNLPLYFIIREITGDYAKVNCILQPGTSEHIYSPSPSDMKLINNSNVVFKISNQIDFWLPDINPNTINVFDFVPRDKIIYFDEEKKVPDTHFWTDPLVIKDIAGKLTGIIILNDKVNENIYRKNLDIFLTRLDSLNNRILNITGSIQNRYVILMHPSMRYFLKRYDFRYAGSIEEQPGKEPTPMTFLSLINIIKKYNIKAVFSEPQLNAQTAITLAESAGIKLGYLDPLGDFKNNNDYFKLMLFNAGNLKKVLE